MTMSNRVGRVGVLLSGLCIVLCLALGFGRPLQAAVPDGYENWYPHQLADASPPARLAGPFRAESCAFFIVHHGGDLSITLMAQRPDDDRLSRDGRRVRRSLFFQTYDAEEKLVDLAYHHVDQEDERVFRKTVSFNEAAPGIYQVRYAKSPGNPMAVDIATDPACSIGVMPIRTRFSDMDSGFIYVPPGEQHVGIPTYAADVTLSTLDGNELGVRGPKHPGAAIEVTGPAVLRVKVAYHWDGGAFNIRGVPPIFCADESTARTIRGSIEVAPDGKLLAHKFQRRMWDWMHALTPADLAIAPRSLLALEDEWVKDPRNVGLLGYSGGFNHIPRILQDQILDPADPKYGLGTNTAWLGPAYVIDKPFNPYRGEPAILNRLVLQEFVRFLSLDENGTFNPDHWDHYFGGDGLGYRQRAFQFGYVSPHVNADLRDLWFEGASTVLHRGGMTRVTCENQTSHWLLDLWLLGEASGRPVYKTMAHDFAIALEQPDCNPFMQTGYQQERYGPDATYQGLSAAQQAIYFEYSGDTVVKEGLKRIYELLNHTVAPEPDGTVRGASNFSHRTSGSWVQRQYNGGVRLMADDLPEAGIWCSDLQRTPEEAVAEIRKRLRLDLDDDYYERNMRWLSTYAYHPWLGFFHEYLFPPDTIQAGTWPATRGPRFNNNVNDEFLFVRRPAYYAAFYTGKTSHEWVKPSYTAIPYPKGWEERDGVLQPTTADSKKTSWRPTQGLSLLWNEAYGNAILGKCWNAYTPQIVRADLADGGVAWPDYWSFMHRFDPDESTLTMTWSMQGIPAEVRREVRFNDDAMHVDLTVQATGEVAVTRLVEQLPILGKDGMTLTFLGSDGQWKDDPGPDQRAVRMQRPDGSAVAVLFETPVTLRIGPASRLQGQTIRCLEVLLGAELAQGDSISARYRLIPADDQSH